MRIAKIKYNDTVDGEGICVSLWTQGCSHHCEGCHNPETWDENGGYEISLEDLKKTIIEAIPANGIKRNFSILGGEPFSPNNIDNTAKILEEVRKAYPDIKIFVWTGYKLEQLLKLYDNMNKILSNIDVLIDGPFILKQRDITLKLRGSDNQRILYKNIDF